MRVCVGDRAITQQQLSYYETRQQDRTKPEFIGVTLDKKKQKHMILIHALRIKRNEQLQQL